MCKFNFRNNQGDGFFWIIRLDIDREWEFVIDLTNKFIFIGAGNNILLLIIDMVIINLGTISEFTTSRDHGLELHLVPGANRHTWLITNLVIWFTTDHVGKAEGDNTILIGWSFTEGIIDSWGTITRVIPGAGVVDNIGVGHQL